MLKYSVHQKPVVDRNFSHQPRLIRASPALAFKGVNYREDPEARYVWIGATRADRRSAWSWSDCSDWALSRWGRSDGDDPALTSGTCGTLFFSGRWRDDVNCTNAKYK